MKGLLFFLFLYVCLIWVLAVSWYEGTEVQKFGLRWTAIGLIALLIFMAGSRIWGWWRLRRARSGVRPAAAPKPAQVVHEDDAALAALIAEANASLAKSPAYAGKRGKTPLSELPLYLLI